MNVIEVDSVSKKFRLGAMGGDLRDRFSALFSRGPREADTSRDFWALRDISFSVAEGESFGIIGHNGSGKSTLLKLLTGIYTPTSGTFKTHGRISALIEVGAGFHPDLTGRENVYLNGSVLGLKKREVDKRFDEIVAFAELEQFIDTPVKRYSSGMYMRLGFAVAAHVDPDIVLVDEVLAVGDESFQAKCMKRMHDLRREGKTIVFISHSMDAVTALCQKVMLLSHGQMLALGEPRDVVSVYRTSLATDQQRRERQEKQANDSNIVSEKKMEILNVSLLDQHHCPCEQITLGEPILLECRFRTSVRIDRPAFGIMLHRADETYIYGFNTKFDGIEVSPVDGESTFRVTFDGLNLMQGLYHFSVLLYEIDDNNGHHELDVAVKAAGFVIASDNLNHGLVMLPHIWHTEPPKADFIEMPQLAALS